MRNSKNRSEGPLTRLLLLVSILVIACAVSSFACPCQPQGDITSQYPGANAVLFAVQPVYFGQEGWTEVTPGGTGQYWKFIFEGVIAHGSQIVSSFHFEDIRTCGATKYNYTAFSSWDYEPGSFSLPADMTTLNVLGYQEVPSGAPHILDTIGPDHWTLL